MCVFLYSNAPQNAIRDSLVRTIPTVWSVFFFPKISTWLTSSPPLDLCPNDTLAVELLQKALPPKPSLSSCPTFFYLEHFLSSDMPCDLLITFCISLLLLRCQVLEGRSCIYPFCSWLCQQQLEHTFNILESNK